LKGSLIGREATKTERDKGGVLKDLDLVNDKQMIHLGKKRDVFLQQLERDANFLASLNIMDYSLLVNSIFLVSLTFFRNLK
jgi:1-phosphatidylinositol-4-phosphate 5-kinase